MIQPGISYKNIKRILAILVLLMGVGIIYSTYTDMQLFLYGQRTQGIVTERTGFRYEVYTIKYSYNGQETTFQEPAIDGPISYKVGDPVAVYYQQAYPNDITTSNTTTKSALGYWEDHGFFAYRIIFMLTLWVVGIMWLRRTYKE